MIGRFSKRIVLLLASIMACAILAPSTLASAATKETLAEWMEGYESAEHWFGDDFAYDITDTKTCWELLQKPITILNVGEREAVGLLQEPGGKRVNRDELGGTVSGKTSAVHVLGKDENGWTLIEGMDEYDRLIRGYVKTKLLKTVTPNKNYGLIIDKLTQRLYVFVDGELFSSCAVSTGIASAEKPFNETASGEYLISSWVGAFETEGLVCEMGLRFNNGDLLHQVPYMVLGDGTKRYSTYEKQLGQKASHGCIRVARYANDDGLNMKWLWNNLKRNTKVVIWDDDGRVLPYPASDTELYYNAQGGSRYHASAKCSGVKSEYYPLKGFLYSELDVGDFKKLEPCDFCTPVKRKAVIDEMNRTRGMIVAEEVQAEAEDGHPVEITIVSAD